MLNVSENTKTAFRLDTAHIEVVIQFPEKGITLRNENIISESLSLNESIETGENLSFIGCNASSFSFQCFYLANDDLVGTPISVTIQANNTDVIPLFNGYVDAVTNLNHEDVTTEITSYDVLKKVKEKDVTDWYNQLGFPINIYNFRNSFFNYVGVTQVSTWLTNDNITINKTIEDNTISGDKIIKAICQINGVFGRINRYGQFEYVELKEGTEALYPSEELYPSDDLYPKDENAVDTLNRAHYLSVKYENYQVAPIDRVQIVDKEGVIASTVAYDETATNAFTVSDNPLVWGLTKDVLDRVAWNILSTVQHRWYVPCSQIESIGLPYIECGDFVLLGTQYNIVRAYVLSRSLRGIQVLRDTYEAPGERKQPIYRQSMETRISNNEQAISNTQDDLSEESSRAKDEEGKISKRVGDIEADYINTQKLEAAEASIGNLITETFSAVTAEIGTLNTKVANVETLAASKCTLGDVQVQGYLKASSLSSSIASLGSLTVPNNLWIGSKKAVWSKVTVGGTTMTVLRTFD